MKAYKVITIITIILAIVVITVAAAFGIYMKKDFKVVNIAKNYRIGMEFAESIVLNFDIDTTSKERKVYDKDGKIVEEKEGEEYKEEDGYKIEETLINPKEVLNANSYEKVREILNRRLMYAGVEQYIVRQDNNTGRATVELANTADIENVMGILTPKGDFEIIDATTKEILLNNSHISKVEVATRQTETGATIALQLTFNKEGRAKLSEISETYKKIEAEQADTSEEKTETEAVSQKEISILLDGEVYGNATYFEEKITNGIYNVEIGSVTSGTASADSQLQSYNLEANTIAIVLKMGPLPITYNITYDGVSSSIGQTTIIISAGIAGGILLLILILYIVKFKIQGVYGFILGIGYISILLFAVRLTNIGLTIDGIMGMIISVLINYAFIYMLLNKVKKEDIGVTEAIKTTMLNYIMKLTPVYIVAVIFIFAFNLNLFSFGGTLFWGGFLMYIYNGIFTNILLRVTKKGA